jgi:protein-S-isoprenylcysteine O-methyltransferase Ste14
VKTAELAPRLVAAIVIELLVIIGILFLPARTWSWARGWTVIALFVLGAIWSVAKLYPHHKHILAARLQSPLQKDQPFTDKILVSILLVTYLGSLVFIPLDVFRIGPLLGDPPFFVSVLGLALAIVGFWIGYRTLVANAFAAPAVKHEESQRVIDTGPYAIVRHPMYAGAALFMLGLPLWLGSIAAMLAALVPIAVLAVRAVFEESFLRRELAGYDDYVRRVPWRLVPHVW